MSAKALAKEGASRVFSHLAGLGVLERRRKIYAKEEVISRGALSQHYPFSALVSNEVRVALKTG